MFAFSSCSSILYWTFASDERIASDIQRDGQEKERQARDSQPVLSVAEVMAYHCGADEARCAGVLRQLDIKCREGEEEIAGMAMTAQGMMKQERITVSALEIAEGLDAAIPGGRGQTSFAEHSAAYTTLRRQGWNHEQTCQRVRLLLVEAGRLEIDGQ